VNKDFSAARMSAETLVVVFQEKRSFAPRAFQQVDSPSALDIISVLVACTTEDFSSRGKEASEINVSMEKAFAISPLCQTAYVSVAVPEHVDVLVASVTESLPPRTDADSIKCYIELPIVSVALQATESTISTETREGLLSLKGEFCNFARPPGPLQPSAFMLSWHGSPWLAMSALLGRSWRSLFLAKWKGPHIIYKVVILIKFRLVRLFSWIVLQ
jgi:hypothetical protein